MYRCEKCNKEFPNYKWRMILSVGISTVHHISIVKKKWKKGGYPKNCCNNPKLLQCSFTLMCSKDAGRKANSINPDQIAVVLSGSSPFAQICLSETFNHYCTTCIQYIDVNLTIAA